MFGTIAFYAQLLQARLQTTEERVRGTSMLGWLNLRICRSVIAGSVARLSPDN